MKTLLSLLAAATLLAVASPAHAVPDAITFTARVTDAQGAPLNDADVQIHLEIFDAAEEGTSVWEETQTVAAANGLIYASLGSNVGAIFDGRPMFLELTIRDDVLAPRIPLAAVPYAMRANVADVAESLADFDPEGVITAVTPGAGLTGGGDAGAVTLSIDTSTVQARITGTCSSGFVTGVAANGAVSCGNAPAGIASVQGSSGITANTSGGAVTLSIGAGAINQNHLDTNAVTETKIGTGAVTQGKIGPDAVISTKIMNGEVKLDDLAPDSVSSTRIMNGEVKLDDLGPDSVNMAKANLPIGMWSGDTTSGSSNVTILSDAVTLPGSGACMVHTWAWISNSSYNLQVEPSMRRVSTGAEILSGAPTKGEDEVQAAAVIPVQNSGDYNFGCKIHNLSTSTPSTSELACRISWSCN